jgi:hypothetical protein
MSGGIAAADVKFQDNGLPYTTEYISIFGQITKEDAKAIAAQKNVLEMRKVVVWLCSEGGDVSAAMAIGRIIREVEGETAVMPTCNSSAPAGPPICYSSCTLIFISGMRRENLGVLGLHRPFFSSEPQSREFIENQVPKMLLAIKEYVSEMGVTENFYQQMINTDPASMRTYRFKDADTIVSKEDPVFSEIRISREARRYGVDTGEMRKRENEAEVKCPYNTVEQMQRHDDCIEAIKWGLDYHVYKFRHNVASFDCIYSADELKTLFATPFRKAWELQFVSKMERCVRDVMLRNSR